MDRRAREGCTWWRDGADECKIFVWRGGRDCREARVKGSWLSVCRAALCHELLQISHLSAASATQVNMLQPPAQASDAMGVGL